MQIYFFIRKNFYKENEPQKLENLKKMSRKRSASNAWAATFKNIDFS